VILTADIRQKFGAIGSCNSLQEVLDAINSDYRPNQRRNAAALAMVLCAMQAVGKTWFYHDTCHVLDQLALAKATLDNKCCHSLDVASTTGAILMDTQIFVYEEVIPCTEWPLPADVAAFVLDKACQLVAM
jgi:hypothetical protein